MDTLVDMLEVSLMADVSDTDTSDTEVEEMNEVSDAEVSDLSVTEVFDSRVVLLFVTVLEPEPEPNAFSTSPATKIPATLVTPPVSTLAISTRGSGCCGP